jgi:hypothetical protein
MRELTRCWRKRACSSKQSIITAPGRACSSKQSIITPLHIHTTYILRRWLPVVPLTVLAMLAVLAVVAAGAPAAATGEKHGSTRQYSRHRSTVQRPRTGAARRRVRAHTRTHTHGRKGLSRAVLGGHTCCASSAAPPSAGAAGRIPAGDPGRIRTGCSRTWPRCRPVLDLCAAEPLSASERAFQKTSI